MFASDSSRSAGAFPGLTPLRPLWVRAALLQASRVGGHGGRFSLRWWRRSERKKTAGQRGVAWWGGTVRRSSQTKQTSLFFPRRVAKVGSAPRLNPLLMDAALPCFCLAKANLCIFHRGKTLLRVTTLRAITLFNTCDKGMVLEAFAPRSRLNVCALVHGAAIAPRRVMRRAAVGAWLPFALYWAGEIKCE